MVGIRLHCEAALSSKWLFPLTSAVNSPTGIVKQMHGEYEAKWQAFEKSRSEGAALQHDLRSHHHTAAATEVNNGGTRERATPHVFTYDELPWPAHTDSEVKEVLLHGVDPSDLAAKRARVRAETRKWVCMGKRVCGWMYARGILCILRAWPNNVTCD